MWFFTSYIAPNCCIFGFEFQTFPTSEEAPAVLETTDEKNPGRLHCLKPVFIEILLEGRVSSVNNLLQSSIPFWPRRKAYALASQKGHVMQKQTLCSNYLRYYSLFEIIHFKQY